MEISFEDARSNNVKFTVDFLTDDGQLVPVDDDNVNPSSSNTDVMAVLSQAKIDSPEGPHYEVTYLLNPVAGVATPSGFGDGDMGTGVRQVNWQGEDVTVTSGEAMNSSVSTGTLVPKA